MTTSNKNIFLFSVDLEDVRLRMPDSGKHKPRVELLVEKYLEFLSKYKSKATFFTVGDIPQAYPGLIKTIVAEGHEIACHSNKHISVTQQTKEEFKQDLLHNIDSLIKAGASDIIGYRAPVYSITPACEWAFEILADIGFKYSSSVLPAKNPLFGWPGFGETPKKVNNQLWEIPVSVSGNKFFNVPFAGGIYFRVLPMLMIKKSFENHFADTLAITSYFHPYDIDDKQERFMHPGINHNYFYNWLMYYNRKNVFNRLDEVMEEFDCSIITYKEYVKQLNGK